MERDTLWLRWPGLCAGDVTVVASLGPHTQQGAAKGRVVFSVVPTLAKGMLRGAGEGSWDTSVAQAIP